MAERCLQLVPELEPVRFALLNNTTTQLAYDQIASNVEQVASKFWRDPNDHVLLEPIDDDVIHKKHISLLRRVIPTCIENEPVDIPKDQLRFLASDRTPTTILTRARKMSEAKVSKSPEAPTYEETWRTPSAIFLVSEYLAQRGDMLNKSVREFNKHKPTSVSEQHLLLSRESMRLFLFGVGGERMRNAIRYVISQNEYEDAIINS